MDTVLSRFSHHFSLPLSANVAIFALLLLIILIGPILSTRFKLPTLVGLIFFGVLIGPHALHLIDSDGAVGLFSTIGLLYIMFIAGLELDINQFAVHRNRSVLFSIFTYLGPFVVVFPIVHYIYDVPLLSSILFATMLGTHTLIAYPAVSRLGVANDPAVAITVGGTILVDTGILIALAVIIGINSGDISAGFWIQLVVSILIFIAFMHFGIGKLSEWFFTNFHSERYLQYTYVLFCIFFSALLAELAGLEAIVGAFGAGLVLNRLIPRSSPLMHNIEFVGNSFFIPLFLVTVGMMVNLGILLGGPYIIILAIVLSIAAIFGKWLAALVSQLAFKLTKNQRNVIFGLSSAHVAATLAVVIVGHKAGLITEAFLNATIILILITCICASIISEKAAKALAIEKETLSPSAQEALATDTEHILLPIANVNNIGKLFDFSLLVKSKKSQNPITVLTVVPNDEEAEHNIKIHRKKLDEYIKTANNDVTKVNVVATIDTSVSDGICRISREQMADLVILGWPKPGIVERIIGEKWSNIINQVDKMVFLAYLQSATHTAQRMILLTPPSAELERGFDMWVQKIVKLAGEWSLSIEHYGQEATGRDMALVIEDHKLTAKLNSNHFEDWDDFLVLSRNIRDTDLIVFVSARRNTLSYLPLFENMPSKLEKYFGKNNKILIFPKQASISIDQLV